MLDKFREWLSDNLRWIILGLAVVLLFAVIIFTVRLLGGSGKRTERSTEAESAQDVIVEEGQTDSRTDNSTAGTVDVSSAVFSQNDDAVRPTIQQYYTAMGSKDIDTLSTVVANLDETSKEKILSDTTVESYDNITTYSTPGLTTDSYVVYTSYDAKLVNVDTLVPSLVVLYLEKNEEGTLVITDPSTVSGASDYINQLNSNSQIQALVKDVTDRYNEAEASDSTLALLMEEMAEPATEYDIPEVDATELSTETEMQSETQLEETTAVISGSGSASITELCNVRQEADGSSTILGMLAPGDQVTVVQTLDSGWAEINWNGMNAYVSTSFVSYDGSTSEAVQ